MKTMMQIQSRKIKLSLIFASLLLVQAQAFAQVVGPMSQNQDEADDGHAHDLKVESIVVMKEFEAAAPVHKVVALVRKDGHAMNRPFVLELRATCDSSASAANWSVLKVGDQESLCGMDPSTLAFDKSTGEVTISYVEPDAEFYKEQVGKKARNIKQRCLKERKSLRLPVARLCQSTP